MSSIIQFICGIKRRKVAHRRKFRWPKNDEKKKHDVDGTETETEAKKTGVKTGEPLRIAK